MFIDVNEMIWMNSPLSLLWVDEHSDIVIFLMTITHSNLLINPFKPFLSRHHPPQAVHL
jgi:hypothetical protein